MTDHRARPCPVPDEHAGPVHPYPCGWRCDRHAPWAIAGRPKPQPGPGLPAGAWTTPAPQAASAVVDDRAIASGKRRSNPQAYRAAQAAVSRRTP